MNCPEHLVFQSRYLWIWMYWRDVPRSTIPLKVWLNPLNYELIVKGFDRRVVINPNGQWIRGVIWRLKEYVRIRK